MAVLLFLAGSYGIAVASRLAALKPDAVDPGVNSYGTSRGSLRSVMYRDDVFHWLGIWRPP